MPTATINAPKAGTCGEECEVYSRVTGYYRPVTRWNKGKAEEFKERKPFVVTTSACPCAK